MTIKRIALLTDSRYLIPKPGSQYVQNILDEDILVQKALEELGFSVSRVAWDDPNCNWNKVDYAILRSTWDYFDRINEFKKWLVETSQSTCLINPIKILDWNLDKHYLLDLKNKGVNTIDTVFVEPGSPESIAHIMAKKNWDEVVIKPAIAATARETYRVTKQQLGKYEIKFARLASEETMLVQAFQNSVLTTGEIALMYFGGVYSHAVLKRAKPGDFRVQDDFGGKVQLYEPNDEERQLGLSTIAACNPTPIYGRVDILIDNQGLPAVTELELLEPELWFRFHPPAASKFASAIKNYILGLS